ncbi:hypothetical protein BXZ70DRAFT_420922 [Cristinia sonorae]|uniref:RING-type domain-containing protein n=1 Tax=Cristinia sonorae TaxID=1940300 RepID=A0A8K0UXB5_9AGAR|nr:hypothetical protein BXZ70DRAFT_420922 [Cristinia sonorae]
MDTLKCNILTCRTALTDKAVVTTCSHIFCVECANVQFNDSRLCPACETSLTEPDDVVVCSLHPTNDYKTSVLSGLNPTVVLEICSRAMSFWQYQMHQELSFQQTVLRTINDKSAYLQKELDNAVREARGQISLLNNKLAEIERDFDLERRKTTSLQDSLKDREKEYQKLKVLYDKIKRKALLAPGNFGQNEPFPPQVHHDVSDRHRTDPQSMKIPNSVPVDVVVGDMNANGIQRTPIASRTMQPPNRLGRLPPHPQRHNHQSQKQQGYPPGMSEHRSYRSFGSISDRSEEENTLTGDGRRRPGRSGSWASTNNANTGQGG